MELKKVIPLFIFFILSIQHYVKAALFLQLKETTTESLLLSVQYILGPYCTEGGQQLCREGMDISSLCFLRLWVTIRNWSWANHCYSRFSSSFTICLGFRFCFRSYGKFSYGKFSHNFSFSYILTSSFPVLCSLFLWGQSWFFFLSEFSPWQGDSGFVMRGV